MNALQVISIIALCAIWFNCGYHVGTFRERRKLCSWLDNLLEEIKKRNNGGFT